MFDTLILGTGLTESILAGAISRHEKVLHLDQNNSYGSQYRVIAGKELLNGKNVSYETYNINNEENSFKAHKYQDLLKAGHGNDDFDFLESIEKESRKFSIEMTPKVLLSRGDTIELIISSGVGPYLEFKLVQELYYQHKDGFDLVPGSKEDIFASKELKLIEKRKLMKFLTFCLSYDGSFDQQNNQNIENQTLFVDFLKSQGLTGTLSNIIINAIALELNINKKESLTTMQGLERVSKHLKSAGRYGKGALLTGLYGTTSELCQAFCRYCAVYGGTYMLDCSVTEVEIADDLIKVKANGEEFSCKRLIVGAGYEHLLGLKRETRKIQRCILISDVPVIGQGKHSLVISALSPSCVYGIQYSGDNCYCPEGKYALLLCTDGDIIYLKSVIDSLLQTKNEPVRTLQYFYQDLVPLDNSIIWHRDNIAILPWATEEILESSVGDSRTVFSTFYPDLKFYPEKEINEE